VRERLCTRAADWAVLGGRSTWTLDVPERYHVSASAKRGRRIFGVLLAPFVATMLLLRIYIAGAFREVTALNWLAISAAVAFMGWWGLYTSRRWIEWAANHALELTDDALVLVDGDEREPRSFSDIAKLDVGTRGGKITSARLTYEGRLKQDLGFYERLPELVAALKSHIPPEKVRG
jgi:hypothetical protein